MNPHMRYAHPCMLPAHHRPQTVCMQKDYMGKVITALREVSAWGGYAWGAWDRCVHKEEVTCMGCM